MRRLLALGLVGFIGLVASCGGTEDPPKSEGWGGTAGTGTAKAGGAGRASGGSAGSGMSCGVGLLSCSGVCKEIATDPLNCGSCAHACASGQSCSAGVCSCTAPLSACTSGCANLASDPANCGVCGTVCAATQVCSKSACGNDCDATELKCGQSCVTKETDPTNCGFCGNVCPGTQACVNGACACAGGLATCNGACTDIGTSALNCGACGHACATGQTCVAQLCTGGGGSAGAGSVGGAGGISGAGGSAGATGGSGGTGVIPPERNGCEITPGLIADFEEGGTDPVVVKTEDRTGEWETYNDATSGATETSTVEASGGTEMCDKFALHVKGTGFSNWGAGFGFSLVGSPMAPTAYNATLHSLTGIRFKAKLGSTADAKSPVRFNVSTPWTEESVNPGGTCTPTTATTTKAAIDCYQHAGRFLPIGSADGELSTSAFKTFTYCFDRDLYPLSLPSNLTTDQRNNIASNILKVQFQFNAGKDYSGSYPTNGEYPEFMKGLPFDIWLDDVEFFSGACPNAVVSPSNSSPAKAFPQNTAVGTCTPPTTAPLFAANIAKAYATWTKNFVQGDHIVAPEQSNHVTSEAMGYGMMIAAAMGDKTAFDKFWGYVQTKLNGGLMNWREDGSGSATDADLDISYALLMAGVQWGGSYAGAAGTMAGNIASKDITNSLVNGGSQFSQANYNPSYFAPAAMRKLSGLSGFVGANYTAVNSNISKGSQRVPTDWAKSDGTPSDAGGASVTSEITDGTNGAMGYDAARVPWRLGLDACLSGATGTGLSDMVGFFSTQYDSGNSIDLMKAGWYKAKAGAHTAAKDVQGSFIGPMGVAGMAVGNAAMRDRAFRALLDIMESGDFNHTYFPSTVGLLSLLALSGNFPTP